MKTILVVLSAVLMTAAAFVVRADTLELADGTLLEGDFVGSSNDIVMFHTGDGIEAFPESEVVGIFLSAGINTASAHATAPSPAYVAVPSGTRLVIRLSESIDSNRHSAGYRFRGQLEGALVIDGVTVAPKGTFVHGRICSASDGSPVHQTRHLAPVD